MRLCLPICAPILTAELDPRFGRAAYFLIVDTTSGERWILDNPALHANGGAGVKAAQTLAAEACEAVIGGDFGPHAFEALSAAGINMALMGDCRTVEQALQAFQAGALELLAVPSAAGRHG